MELFVYFVMLLKKNVVFVYVIVPKKYSIAINISIKINSPLYRGLDM